MYHNLICDKCRYGYVFLPADNNINKRSECIPKKLEAEYTLSVDSKTANANTNKNTQKITDNRRRRKKNSSNYFSIINIFVLQTVCIFLLLINF